MESTNASSGGNFRQSSAPTNVAVNQFTQPQMLGQGYRKE